MQAILIAARIDVYGILYGVLLLAMLVIPQRFLVYSWIGFVVVHGTLLVVQYLMLLGLPPSVLCEKGMDKWIVDGWMDGWMDELIDV